MNDTMYAGAGKALRRSILAWTVLVLIGSFLSGCEHVPARRLEGYSASIGERAADIAISMVGRPYRSSGAGPSGFDCSGLVYFSYSAAGMKVPRTTRELRRHAVPVSLRGMQKGDLVFFDQEGKPYSHVGIYAGDNQFVHSPGTGKRVRKNSLRDPYWKKHLLEARRF